MRICFLADARSWHTTKWLQYFVENGHEVHLIGPDEFWDKRVHSHLVEMITLPGDGSLLRLWNSYTAFKAIVESIKPDILHAISARNGLFGAMMGFSPLVLTGLGWDVLLRPKLSLLKQLETAFILSRIDISSTESVYTQKEMLKYQKNKNSEIIVFGVDKREFHLGISTESLKAELGIDGYKVILSPRSMLENLNIDVIIRAIPLVLEKIPKCVFVFKYNYGHLQSHMEDLARSLGVLQNSRFVGFVADHTKVPAYYRISDACVSIPSSDSTARAWFESIACETPLVLSDIPNTHEWFADRENAMIVPLRDPAATAASIIEIIQNEPLRKKLISNASLLIETRGDYVHNMMKMEQIYSDLIGSKRD